MSDDREGFCMSHGAYFGADRCPACNPPPPDWRAIAADLAKALERAEAIMSRMDTLRHLSPEFPELDEADAALSRWEAAK